MSIVFESVQKNLCRWSFPVVRTNRNENNENNLDKGMQMKWRRVTKLSMIWSQITSYTTSKYSIFDHKGPQNVPKVDTLGVTFFSACTVTRKNSSNGLNIAR